VNQDVSVTTDGSGPSASGPGGPLPATTDETGTDGVGPSNEMGTGRAAARAAAPRPPTPGACIWLTGVSGSGKSTLTRALVPRLHELGRTVTVLDVVPLLAKQAGERTSEGKLLRKAFVAGEIAAHGGLAICVTVSARREVRERAREIVGRDRFVEVLVEVPEEVAAERRAARGRRVPMKRRLRALGRAVTSRLRGTTEPGYEAPTVPDVTVDTVTQRPEDGADVILEVLRSRGLLSASASAVDRSDVPRGSVA
jgi:sulfate adenylyltransferase